MIDLLNQQTFWKDPNSFSVADGHNDIVKPSTSLAIKFTKGLKPRESTCKFKMFPRQPAHLHTGAGICAAAPIVKQI